MVCSLCRRISLSDSLNPFVPQNGDCDTLLYSCPYCHTKWWQYYTQYHFWTTVSDLRFHILLKQLATTSEIFGEKGNIRPT